MELLRVSLEDPRPWKQAVDALYSFLPEGVFYFNSDGVRLRAIDPSQVVMVDFFAPRSVFREYNLVESPIRVPIDLSEYTKILSRASSEDRLVMALEDVNLYVLLELPNGTLRREFYIPLMDVPDREAEIAPVEGVVTVRVLGRIIKDALKDAGIFSSSAVLVARDDVFMVEAKGQTGVTRTVAREGDGVSIEGGPEAVSRYSLSFLQNIVRAADPDGFVTMVFGNDTPLKISYEIGGIRLTFFLAQMIL
ncbi:MAG: proliferating cell nuclear antigen [Candidatus Diapherotrites archaeon]|nr:proliferating cell nuclear antigen [Candidatus Diapherotrites archaeon]MDN5366609.1 proliferating cell nuclear antigen [Candidatus Diapherotrites archaeon]